jgi:hypothetical protein
MNPQCPVVSARSGRAISAIASHNTIRSSASRGFFPPCDSSYRSLTTGATKRDKE